ncbi:MAG TPA: hypothetical protein VJZ94_03455, partial [Candidatus Paceibacterota bacterium]|nr:hypothetical protein [Candidatus Paceibacterota bacterium]
GNHPELTAKIYECYLNLTSGEQSQIVFSVELNDKDEKVLIDVRVFKKPGQPDYPILFGWPRSKKYYDT